MHTQLAVILATELRIQNKTKQKHTKNKNKTTNKKPKVVSFLSLEHKISPQPNVRLNFFFLVLESSAQELKHIKYKEIQAYDLSNGISLRGNCTQTEIMELSMFSVLSWNDQHFYWKLMSYDHFE